MFCYAADAFALSGLVCRLADKPSELMLCVPAERRLEPGSSTAVVALCNEQSSDMEVIRCVDVV